MAIAKFDARPWYREPWPWIIIAGPASAVVAGVALLWLAIDSNDGLVVDDYYKEGLAINQVIRRDQAAFDLRYRAQAVLSEYFDRFDVPNGDSLLVVSSELEDAQYFTQPYWTSTHFKKQSDASGWNPKPCE